MLRIEGLCLGWAGRRVVDGLWLRLAPGQTVALVGPSGCGKTLVALTLLGLPPETLQIEAGAVRLDGVDLLDLPLPALQGVRGRRIGLVFQEPERSLHPARTVGAQLVEVVEAHGPWRGAAARARAAGWLAEVGLAALPAGLATWPHQLSGGEQQRVAIALALAGEPALLVADEPTSALDPQARAAVLDLLQRLQRQRGLGLLLISHDEALVADHADVVVRMPQPPGEGEASRLPFPADGSALPPARSRPPDGGPALHVRGLRVVRTVRGFWPWQRTPRTVVDGLSLEIAAGETVALVGPSGAGKTTAARAIAGLLPDEDRVEGEVVVAGVPRHPAGRGAADRHRALRGLVQMVFQEPRSSFDPRLTMAESMAEGLRALRPQWSVAERQSRMVAMVARVGLDPGLLARRPQALSGGQCQRFALARALVVAPRVLVCDEPTAALDGPARDGIVALLRALQQDTGVAMLLVSHDAALVDALARSVVELPGGLLRPGSCPGGPPGGRPG